MLYIPRILLFLLLNVLEKSSTTSLLSSNDCKEPALPYQINFMQSKIIILTLMKLRTKKGRFLTTRQQNLPDNRAESILHEYSENQEHRLLSKSFAYGRVFNINNAASSLSTWGENVLTPDKADDIKQLSIQVSLPKDKHNLKDRSIRKKFFDGNPSLQQISQKSKKDSRYLYNTRRRSNTTRTRCIINVLNPKFDDQRVQSKIKYVSNSPLNLSHSMRETVRDRKGILIKRIKKEYHFYGSKSEQKSSQTQNIKKDEQIKQGNKKQHLKMYSEIELKFSDSSFERPHQNSKASNESNSLRVSRLLAYKNSHSTRGKGTIKKPRIKDQNLLRTLQEVNTLRSLINRQMFQKIRKN